MGRGGKHDGCQDVCLLHACAARIHSLVGLKTDEPFRPIPFSIFDPIVSVFTEKYGNGTEIEEDLFRPFLRDPVFSRIEPVFILYLTNIGRT
jgi:hypothetical protein